MSGSPLEKFKSVFHKSSRSSSRERRTNSSNDDMLPIDRNIDNDYNDVQFEDPPLTPLILQGYKSTTKHRLLNNELAEEIRQHIPSLLQINHNWELLYSIDQCGTSLHTLYQNCHPKYGENMNRRRGYVLIVQDTKKNIFGAYLNDYLRPLDGRYYYGNGDCFLWKVEKGNIKNLSHNNINSNSNSNSNQNADYDEDHSDVYNLKIFPYTSLNDFIIYSNNEFISVGSGDGKFGLWIDSNLDIGASDTVETFGNEPLTQSKKFHILGLEIWKIA